ncbi:MAG: DNA polymerase III subunit alpha, partial [Elusimicrobiaceae bacterium]|nr:DNA polymerase III subunit alpha [Elusimicrobiaceae bacterium]
IEYVRGKYGANNVANIITFGTIKAKLAIKDVARVLGFLPVEANRLAKLIPNSLDATVAGAIETVPELAQEAARDPRVRQLLDFAQKIEGLKRHTGVHAAGVVVTREEVTKYAPLAVGAKKIVTTQYEGPVLEKLGLLKMDFLGLRTLTVIDKAVEKVNSAGGVLDISKIPLDDRKTYGLLQSGETTGVFQLESRGMRDLVKSLRPTQFSDISALVALYRPGPMQAGMLETFVGRKHGRKKIIYDHPLMEPILKETYGTIIYQEQVMEIAKSMAGFTPGQADGLRKAMGKKNLEAMQKDRERFLDGCRQKEVPPALARKIFEQMEQFASYGFNKSHSVAYALVAYQTAYLKANYPVEFMTAALTSEIGHNAIGAEDKENKIVTYLDEARRMGIAVLGPDVQFSLHDFSVEKTESGERGIRFGLHAVKNVGDEAAGAIVAARRAGGRFKSLQDLCIRVDSASANKKTFESLIKAGAMDSLLPAQPKEDARARLLVGLEREMGAASTLREEKASGQGSLFGAEEHAVCSAPQPGDAEIEPMSEHELLNNEKEVLGFYLSGHPLVRYEKQLRMIAPGTIAELRESAPADGEELPRSAAPAARVSGIIVSVAKKQSRAKKEPWAQLVLEDLTGRITVNVFPKNYPDCAAAIKTDSVVAITGRVSVRPDSDPPEVEIVADEVVPVAQAISRYGRCLKVKLPAVAPEERIRSLAGLFHRHRGDTPVYIVLEYSKEKKTLVQTEFCVALGEKLFEELDKMVTARGWLVESGAPASAPAASYNGRRKAR